MVKKLLTGIIFGLPMLLNAQVRPIEITKPMYFEKEIRIGSDDDIDSISRVGSRVFLYSNGIAYEIADTNGYATLVHLHDTNDVEGLDEFVTSRAIKDSVANTYEALDNMITPKILIGDNGFISSELNSIEVNSNIDFVVRSITDYDIFSRGASWNFTNDFNITTNRRYLFKSSYGNSVAFGLNDNEGDVLLKVYSDPNYTDLSSMFSLGNTATGGVSYWRNFYNNKNNDFNFSGGFWNFISTDKGAYLRISGDSLRSDVEIKAPTIYVEDSIFVGGDWFKASDILSGGTGTTDSIYNEFTQEWLSNNDTSKRTGTYFIVDSIGFASGGFITGIDTITALSGAKTASFSHDASVADVGAYTLSTSGAVVISILNLTPTPHRYMQGTIFVDIATNPSALTVNTYSDGGTTGLTEVVVGNPLANAANKHTTITYTCVNNGTETITYLVYGQEL